MSEPAGWIELRDLMGKLWGEYDPDRRLLRFRAKRDGPAILFDLADYDTSDAGKAANIGIYLPGKGDDI